MKHNSKILIAGANGMVGSSIYRLLISKGYKNIIAPSKKKLNFEKEKEVESFFKKKTPEYVIIAAAKVGGIYANNTLPVDFLINNLKIQNNIINCSYNYNVKKLLFLGSSCIYPLKSKKLKERDLLSGYVEPTNESYAIAKIAGMKLCEAYSKQFRCDFRSVIPCNLYGYGDNYNLRNSHVLPALVRKFENAKIKKSKTVEIWGDGSPVREFMFVDDLADAIYNILKLSKDKYNKILKNNKISFLNIGTSKELTIKDLAYLIKNIIGFKGRLVFNEKFPNGNPYKVLNCDVLFNFWKPRISLKEGLKYTIQDYRNNKKILRK